MVLQFMSVIVVVKSVDCFSGGGKGTVLLEQRLHHQFDRGEFERCSANHVSGIVQDIERALEPDDCSPCV